MSKQNTESQIDISVIVSAFNASSTIEECLDSVNQPIAGLYHEIIVVNDGSQDDTLSLIRKYNFKVPVKVIDLKSNLGRPIGLNFAIDASHARYIAVLDADDIRIPEKLKMSYDYLETNQDIDLVAGQFIRFGTWGTSKKSSKLPTKESEIKRKFSKGQNPIAHSSVIYRRKWVEDIGKYDSSLKIAPDFDLFLRGYKGANYRIFEDVFYYYRSDKPIPSRNYFINNERSRRAILLNQGNKNMRQVVNRGRYSIINRFLVNIKYFMLIIRTHIIKKSWD